MSGTRVQLFRFRQISRYPLDANPRTPFNRGAAIPGPLCFVPYLRRVQEVATIVVVLIVFGKAFPNLYLQAWNVELDGHYRFKSKG